MRGLPFFIEMGIVLTSSGRNSTTPVKAMPIDGKGAVTIYSVAPLKNGFFVWFALKVLPHMLDSCMLQTQGRGAVAGRDSLWAVHCSPGPGCRGHLPCLAREERPLQVLTGSQALTGFRDSVT